MSNGEMNPARGLGDIAPKYVDPLETYFDTRQQGVVLPRKRWIVAPEWQPCEVRSDDPLVQKLIRAQQEAMECHALPRLWQLLMDFWTKLQCGTYFAQPPAHLAPPFTAQALEIIATNGLGTLINATTPIKVASYSVPDRVVGSLTKFGNNISAIAQIANIQWNIKLNNKPIFGYAGFFGSFGAVDEPQALAAPILLKPGDVVDVTAQKIVGASPDVTAFCRLQGHSFPAPKIDQTGDFSQFHSR